VVSRLCNRRAHREIPRPQYKRRVPHRAPPYRWRLWRTTPNVFEIKIAGALEGIRLIEQIQVNTNQAG